MPAKTNVKAAQNIELSLTQKVTLIIGLSFSLNRVFHRVFPQRINNTMVHSLRDKQRGMNDDLCSHEIHNMLNFVETEIVLCNFRTLPL